MVKVMLKEPVGGTLNPQGGSARSIQYLDAAGDVTKELQARFDEELVKNGSLSFVSPQGTSFLVAARNIAFILEYSPNANTN